MKTVRNRCFSFIMIAVLIAALFVGCAPQTEIDAPLLWEVTSQDSEAVIYLFGSIHAADESAYPLDDIIMNAFDSSEYLAVEADILTFQESITQQFALVSMMMYSDGQTVVDELGEELYQQALSVISEYDIGLPVQMLDLYRPYMWMSIMSGFAVEKAGMASESGLDMFFLTQARERDMPILEVESVEFQIELLTGLAPEIQRQLVESALDVDQAAEELIELYEMWKRGNRSELEASFFTEIPDEEPDEWVEEYNQVFLIDRNMVMVETAEQYLQEDKNVFYVVGLLHMLGEDGMVDQLTQRGYKVKQLT